MKRISMYMHQNNYIELFFDEDTLKFRAHWGSNQSPLFDTPLEALNHCRRLIELSVAYDYKLQDVRSIYKGFFDADKAPLVQDRFSKLDREMWSLDYVFAQWALPRVLYYKIFCCDNGIPGCFVVFDDQMNQLYVEDDEWENILTEIVTGLRLLADDCGTMDKDEDAKIQRGLYLFAKYIRGMWT